MDTCELRADTQVRPYGNMSVSDTMDFDENASRRAEAMYLTGDMVEVRRRTIEALGLIPGARALDVGSGPGLFAGEMAAIVGPSGRVCGIDLSEAMVAIARARCADSPQVDFRIGDAVSLPFPDGEFDACVSVQTLEFVPDVEAALSEFYRVLRPGGRLVIVDTDWGATALNCEDEALSERVMDGWRESFAHPRLPLTLGSRLAASGFLSPSVGAIPILNIAYGDAGCSFHLIRQILGVVPGRTEITQEEADAWARDVRAQDERGAYFFAQTRYLFTAQKPS